MNIYSAILHPEYFYCLIYIYARCKYIQKYLFCVCLCFVKFC